MGGIEMNQEIKTYQNAVEIIKTAILQSQARAAKAVNQEQLALCLSKHSQKELGSRSYRSYQQPIEAGTAWTSWILSS